MRRRLKTSVRVIVHPQTYEDERHFNASLNQLLAVMVRQHISGLRSNHEHTKCFRGQTLCNDAAV